MVVQHFWCRKIIAIVCRVPREWVKSKFLWQDADGMSLADKCIGLDALSAGTMTKFSWRRASSLTTSGSLKMVSCLVLTECFSRRILRFRTSAIDLIHSERVLTSTSSFFAHRLAYSSHASMIMPKFLCHEYETGSCILSPCSKDLSVLHYVLYWDHRSVAIWPHGAYRNCKSQQLQGGRSWERPWKSSCCKLVL